MAKYVFNCHDAHRGPLQPPYNDPYWVVETGDKTFVVDVGGRMEHVSVNRLKPAHLDLDQAVEVARLSQHDHPPAGARGAGVPTLIGSSSAR